MITGFSWRVVLFCVITFAACALNAQTLYKCPDANGRLSLQDTPCSGGAAHVVKPASGVDTGAPSVTEAPAAPKRDMKGAVDLMTKERRIREVTFEIEQRGGRIAGVQADADRRMASLRADKTRAKNNLAGATWEQSISLEMQAKAMEAQGKTSSLQSEIAGLEKELAALKAPKP